MANDDPKPLIRARSVINNGLRDGKVVRPSACSKCKKRCTPEGHHPDHSKPDKVVWLCASCHHNVDDKAAWRLAAKKATGK